MRKENNMKTFTKALSIFLSILMVIYLVPASVYAQRAENIASLFDGNEDAEPISESLDTEAYALGEDISMRTENAKYIRMSDGSYYVAMYDQPVHYLDADDVWQEIDNTLSASDAKDSDDYAGVEAKNGSRSVKFANNSNAAGLLTIKDGSYQIRFSLVDANKSKAAMVQNPGAHSEDDSALEKITDVKKGVSRVLYEDILDGVDLEYVVIGNSVKENLIVKKRADSYVYSFDMRLNKLTAELGEDGEILLKDEKTGEPAYRIALPFMIDANGAVSTNVEYTLTQTKNKEYRITVTADADWMNEDERAFPVTIDPPIEVVTDAAVDTYVDEGAPDTSNGSTTLSPVGYLEEKAFRYYWKLSSLPDIPQNSIITSSSISLHLATVATISSSAPVCVYEVSGAWDETMTWNTQPVINSTVVDYEMVSADMEDVYLTWDITRIAKKWYYGAANNGVSFRTLPESGTFENSLYAFFYTADSSSLRPIFTVSYRNSAGLEDYYTYHTQSVGRAGTGYLQDYTSQLTLVRTDITADSTVLPFTISHVYNDAYAGQMFSESSNDHVIHTVNFASMTMGYGWKLSVQETVVPVTIGGELYYVYNDSDGTEHYFALVDGTYRDEDGLGLTLSISGSQYTMTDKMDNQKLFVNGILYKITDANGNTVRMVYNGSGGMPMVNGSRLQKVERYLSGYLTQSTAETLATFEYDALGRLSTIIDLVGRETAFTYTGNQLTGVTYPDGTAVQYTYTDDILTSAYDGEAKYGIEYSVYTYPSSSQTYNWKTVRMIQEYYVGTGGKSYGQELQVENVFGLYTRYTDPGKNGTFGSPDDVITTYCFDNEGRTTGVYSNDGNFDTTYGASTSGYTDADGTSGKRNRIDSFGVTGALPQNLLTDGSAEKSGTWTVSGTGARTTARKHTGNYSLMLTSPGASSSEMRYYQTSPTLYYGSTYTVSAYVDVSALSSIAADGGVYLKASNGTEVHTGQKLNFNLTEELDNKWQRISLTFSPEYSGAFAISVCLSGAAGTVYIDDIQLEENPAPSTYNLLGGIDEWDRSAGCSASTYADAYGSRDALYLLGNPDGDVYAEQTVPIGKSAKTTFIVSAWAFGYAVPQDEEAQKLFALLATLEYTDGTEESVAIPFQSEIWGSRQFVSGILVPSAENENKTIENVTLTILYRNNCNGVYVFDLALVEEEVQTYSYDNNGNLTAATQTDTSTISSTYDNLNNLTSTAQNNQLYDYTYKTTGNKHLLDTVENDGITMAFTYDSAGNVTGTVVTGISTSEYLESWQSNTANGNHVAASEDTNGSLTQYTYNPRELLISVLNEKGVATEYDYDEYNDRMFIAYISGLVSVNYNYVDGMLSSIVRGGYINGVSAKQNQTYAFAYDGFGNVTSIWVGNDLLVSYTYADDNGNLTRTTYGDGTYIDNVYDDLDRIIQIKIDGAVKYNYSYNGNGDLYRVEDVDNDTVYCYTYDSLGRLLSSWQQTDETVNALTYYTYDDQNRVSEYYCGLTGVTGGTLGQTYSYAYDTNDGNLISIQVSGENMNGDLLEYSYDGLKRLSEKQISGQYRTLAAEYDYETLSGGRSTTLVSGLSWTLQGAAALAYTYDYDALGNIVGVMRDGYLEAGYTYDDQGQLITEYLYNEDIYYTYNYDTYGNIRTVIKRDLITDEILDTEIYSYMDGSWLDQLTSYNGATITYDEIGNPASYNNGSAYNFAWENGRELSIVYHNGIVTRYEYGADGLRTQKKYGSTTYNYYYADGQLIRQTWGTHYIDFLYDETGSVYSIINDGTQYYFVKNLQGDVVQIRSIYGTVVVEYTYDAWGNVLSITGMYADTLGVNNPIRYRGYYQDFETGFYYLQSRYYDPAVRRFINADGYINANDDLLGYNMYAYCGNNPVNRNDDGGMFWDTILDVVSLVVSVVEVVANPTDPWAWAGLVGDTIDLIPFVSGVGEVTRAVRTMDHVVDTIDSAHDAGRALSNAGEAAKHIDDLQNLRQNQKALSDLGKEIERNARKGKFISYEEAKIFDEWCIEYSIPQHHAAQLGSGKHWITGWDHTHFYGRHIPFK